MTFSGSLVLLPTSLFLLVCIFAVFIHPACGRINWTCSLLHDDIPSRTALASVVFEGRARRPENLPSWVNQKDREHFNVTFKPRIVYKGSLPRTTADDAESPSAYAAISVGIFGVEEDREACVPSVQLGSRYLVFLEGNGTPTEYNRLLSFYRIFNFPEPFTPEAAGLVQEYSCSNCTSPPTTKLSPSQVEIKLKQKLLLRCVVVGKPLPVVSWYKDGREVVVGDKRIKLVKRKSGVNNLRIKKAKLEDAGNYVCHATNVLAESYSNTTVVSITPSVETPFKPQVQLCSTQNFCLNGGVCYTIPALGRKFCECETHFTGLRCQDRETFIRRLLNRQDDIKLETILIGSILIVVILLLIVLLSLLCTICSTRDKYIKISKNNRYNRSQQSIPSANHMPPHLYDDANVHTDLSTTENRSHGNAKTTGDDVVPVGSRRFTTATKHGCTSKESHCTLKAVVTNNCNVATEPCISEETANCKPTQTPSSSSATNCNKRTSRVAKATVCKLQNATDCKCLANCGDSVASELFKENRLSSEMKTVTSECNQEPPIAVDCVTVVTAHRPSANCDIMMTTPGNGCRETMMTCGAASNCSRDNCHVTSAVVIGQAPCNAVMTTVPVQSKVTMATGRCNAVPTCVVDVKTNGCNDDDDNLRLRSRHHHQKRYNCNDERNSQEGNVSSEGCNGTSVADNPPLIISEVVATVGCHSKSPRPMSDITSSSSSQKPPTTFKKTFSGHFLCATVNDVSKCDGISPKTDVVAFDKSCKEEKKKTTEDKSLSSCHRNDNACVDFEEIELKQRPRSVHTVPKQTTGSSSKKNVLSERCSSSDFGGDDSPASDLEVNMESEADIQALNASEEELGHGFFPGGRSKLSFRGNYESSIETTDSESSVSSHEQDHSLLDRLRCHHQQLQLQSTTTSNGPREDRGGGDVELLDWVRFSCPFNFGALDHTFTLNPYDVMYANKYVARNNPKNDDQPEDENDETEIKEAEEKYPYDPDPDATVV